jgi:hypothetical protein
VIVRLARVGRNWWQSTGPAKPEFLVVVDDRERLLIIKDFGSD